MTLEEYALPLAYEAALWVDTIVSPTLTIAEMGDLSLKAMSQLRTLAIIALLTKADRNLFGQNIIRSARVRLAYLERLKRDGVDDYHSASGRIGGVVDALAAADFDLARHIVAVSRTDWVKDAEYEDDYCYAQLIHGLTSDRHSPDHTAELLTQFETALDGAPSARLAVCQALYSVSQTAFDEAFDQLIASEQARIASDKARAQLEEPEVVAQRYVFLEGLAVLRLAETRGLSTQAIYKGCPPIAKLETPPVTPEL